MTALLAIIVGFIVLIVCLVLALKVLGIVIGLAAAVFVYFVAERVVGKGR